MFYKENILYHSNQVYLICNIQSIKILYISLIIFFIEIRDFSKVNKVGFIIIFLFSN